MFKAPDTWGMSGEYIPFIIRNYILYIYICIPMRQNQRLERPRVCPNVNFTLPRSTGVTSKIMNLTITSVCMNRENLEKKSTTMVLIWGIHKPQEIKSS